MKAKARAWGWHLSAIAGQLQPRLEGVNTSGPSLEENRALPVRVRQSV